MCLHLHALNEDSSRSLDQLQQCLSRSSRGRCLLQCGTGGIVSTDNCKAKFVSEFNLKITSSFFLTTNSGYFLYTTSLMSLKINFTTIRVDYRIRWTSTEHLKLNIITFVHGQNGTLPNRTLFFKVLVLMRRNAFTFICVLFDHGDPKSGRKNSLGQTHNWLLLLWSSQSLR